MDNPTGAIPLAERVALVTGAASGIGEAIVRDLVAHGARVVVNARREDRLRELADTLNRTGAGRVAVVAGDVTDSSIIAHLLDAAAGAFGRDLDLVVASAGRGLAGSVLTSDTAAWGDLFQLDLTSTLRLLRAAGESMARGGSDRARDIVVIGSCVARNVWSRSGVYGAAKAALSYAAEALRRELSPQRVRVSLVEPGIVQTEFFEAGGYTPQHLESCAAQFGRLLDPADVARVVTFLVSQPSHVHVNQVSVRPVGQDYP